MYCKIFLCKKTGQFNVGIFGDNHKLMFVSKDFSTMFDAKKLCMRMIDKMTIMEYNPKPVDYVM